MAYTPYGYRSPASGLRTLPGFNGERRDPVTGHYLLGNGYRAFNPVLMRFNGADHLSPFGKGGINPYAYCQGDPINYVDPTGRFLGRVGSIVKPGMQALKLAKDIAGHPTGSKRLKTIGKSIALVGTIVTWAGGPGASLTYLGGAIVIAIKSVDAIHAIGQFLTAPVANTKAFVEGLVGLVRVHSIRGRA